MFIPLPAENAAIQNNLHPHDWTLKNISTMKSQLQRLGLSIDWDKELSTCSEDYYKHQQSLFSFFFKKGLVYKKESYINWDPVDNTVLAKDARLKLLSTTDPIICIDFVLSFLSTIPIDVGVFTLL